MSAKQTMKEQRQTGKNSLGQSLFSTAPLGTLFALLCLSAAVAAQAPPVPDPQATEAVVAGQIEVRADSISSINGEAAEETPSRQRIVDPTKFPPRQNGVARVLLAPFRTLGPKLNQGLTAIEEKNALERVRVLLSSRSSSDAVQTYCGSPRRPRSHRS
ncbi:MAG: hypothetical protein L0099_04020, partial [Acidobacteria bacterium]|nr:hypothetical protein [Acidobacteriota bacterium]